MAVVRARSSPPYALIIFIFLWVVATALAVVFYMQFDKAEKAREDAERAALQVRKTGEKRLVDQYLMGQSGPNAESALGVADKQIQLLKLRIANDTSKSVDEIANPESGLVKLTLDKAGKKDMALIPAVRALADDVAKAKAEKAAAEAKLKAETDAYQAAKDQYKKSTDSGNVSADAQKDEVKKLSEQVAEIQRQLTAQKDQDEKTLTQTKEDFEKLRRQFVLELDAKNNEIKMLRNKISTLEQALSNLRPTAKMNVGREPDGRIVRASTGDGEAYINLGKKDHVLPGLTFAVYDPKLGVRSDNEQEAAGKGGLEVLEVGEAESLCRITHITKGQTIQSGDLIANPVYNTDKNRKYRFVVFGDFDLDGDSQSTSQERERIVRLIQAWGGIVDDAISTQTDFLVIGARPATMITKYEGADEAGSIAKAQEQKQLMYDELVKDAKSSSVPILNQNRFLAMVGYYNTTIVQH